MLPGLQKCLVWAWARDKSLFQVVWFATAAWQEATCLRKRVADAILVGVGWGAGCWVDVWWREGNDGEIVSESTHYKTECVSGRIRPKCICDFKQCKLEEKGDPRATWLEAGVSWNALGVDYSGVRCVGLGWRIDSWVSLSGVCAGLVW